MNMNPTAFNLVQMMRNGGNPQQLVMSMMQGRAQNNPVLNNLLTLAQNNQGADIEQFARNMLKEQGFDYDAEFNKFKQMLGVK